MCIFRIHANATQEGPSWDGTHNLPATAAVIGLQLTTGFYVYVYGCVQGDPWFWEIS